MSFVSIVHQASRSALAGHQASPDKAMEIIYSKLAMLPGDEVPNTLVLGNEKAFEMAEAKIKHYTGEIEKFKGWSANI